MFCVPLGSELVVIEGGGPVIAVVENVAKTALQFVDELRLKVPANEPVEAVICSSLAERDVAVSCCCSE